MTENTQIQLNPNRISYIPFQAYENDFTFIVNGYSYPIPKVIADIISPVINNLHRNDASINEFIINTTNSGNFQIIIDLVNCQQSSIPENDIPFFVEVIEILGITSDDILDLNRQITLNNDNIFGLIRRHEQLQVLYSDSFERDINYVASQFFSLCETHQDEMSQLLPETLERIISNERLKLKNEDQLVKFINQVYRNSNNFNYSNLYKYVLFANVDDATMTSFVDIYDYNYFDRELWVAISKRLKFPIIKLPYNENERYEEPKGKVFHPQYEDNLAGIINYLRSQTTGNISQRIRINASSVPNSSCPPNNVVVYENKNAYFYTNNSPNSYISFDFKSNKVIPTDYQIVSFYDPENCLHPKSWVIEGSNDNNTWEILNEQRNCEFLNGSYKSHIFEINNPDYKDFRFIRMRMTGPNWSNNNQLNLGSFELYGKLV